MRRICQLAAAATISLVLALVPVAGAKDPEVLERGPCSGRSDWKLKLSPEDGRIEIELEVDQNVVGARWRVRLLRDGRLVLDRVLRTTAPSGSFEARRVVANPAGPDRVTARARNLRTGELCRASATARF